jgi:MerR family transcriptional regulator/heat shock protein HspR
MTMTGHAMSRAIVPREQVAERLAVAPGVLIRYESLGLVRAVRSGTEEGYGPEEIRRAWTIVSLQRDLGINLAGVEAILKLRAHLDELHRRLDQLAHEWHEALEARGEPGDFD